MKIEVEIDEKQFGLLCDPADAKKLFVALNELYGTIWCEAVYDARCESTRALCARLLPHIQQANKILRFKK
jgi:hypothetical protein